MTKFHVMIYHTKPGVSSMRGQRAAGEGSETEFARTLSVLVLIEIYTNTMRNLKISFDGT